VTVPRASSIGCKAVVRSGITELASAPTQQAEEYIRQLANVGTYEYSRHAKSVWSPSSLLMSSLEKVRPCMKPRFFSQKMLQKLH